MTLGSDLPKVIGEEERKEVNQKKGSGERQVAKEEAD